MRFPRLSVGLLLGAAALAGVGAEAQTLTRVGVRPNAQQMDGRRPIGIVTINPFAIIFGGFNGDVELALGAGFTGALSGTWFNEDDWDYSAVDVTFRYYPGERQPEGFSVGISAGYVNVEEVGDEGKGATVGFIGGYNWLLGRSKRLAIATGLGAKRLFIDEDKYPNALEAMVTGRLGIGISF